MRAQEEYQKNAIAKTAEPQTALVPYRVQKDLLHHSPRWYEEIKSRLDIRYPDRPLKTILFTGSSHRSGVSMTSQGYANYLANAHPNKVLLIRVNLDGAQRNQTDSILQLHEFSNMFSCNLQVDNFSDPNRAGILFAVNCSQKAVRPSGRVALPNEFDQFLHAVRENFDYVVLDAPPVTLFPETRMMCKKSDGVILVLEFGKTCKQVDGKIKQELEAAGANFLGVVINKRKYYIPKWIYKRL
jgi:Mrp family chromosome partitioning ATPase